MKVQNYRRIFGEVRKRLESTRMNFACKQKKIMREVRLCSRFSDKVYAAIILINLLEQSPSVHSEKQIYLALMKCISKIGREQSEFLSYLLSTQGNSILLNMAWTQRYVLRIHLEDNELAHLNRLNELRKEGLSDSFDYLLELGRYTPCTCRRHPKPYRLSHKRMKRRMLQVA